MRRTYEIGAEPRGHTYNDLLYRSFPWCAELLLVVVPLAGGADPLLPGGRAVLEELAPFLRTVMDEREWPGTRLEGGATGRVHRYTLHPEVLDVLARATDRLYGWTPPSLPQDIALIRGDGEPFLVTVTLEAWASLSLEPEEHAQLASELPELALRDLWG